MIKSYRHKGIERFFATGTKAGIQSNHAGKLKRQLTKLDEAIGSEDMNIIGWNLHQLKGKLSGYFSVKVSGNWRLTFAFEDGDAVLVDYQDYH